MAQKSKQQSQIYRSFFKMFAHLQKDYDFFMFEIEFAHAHRQVSFFGFLFKFIPSIFLWHSIHFWIASKTIP